MLTGMNDDGRTSVDRMKLGGWNCDGWMSSDDDVMAIMLWWWRWLWRQHNCHGVVTTTTTLTVMMLQIIPEFCSDGRRRHDVTYHLGVLQRWWTEKKRFFFFSFLLEAALGFTVFFVFFCVFRFARLLSLPSLSNSFCVLWSLCFLV